MAEVALCTREMVQSTLNQADFLRNNALIDRAIHSGTRDVEGYVHRRFYPTTATRYPDPRRHLLGDVLWLDSIEYDLISLTSLAADGTTYTEGTDFYLDPEGEGPPYESIRLTDASALAWPATARSIVLTGEFGASARTRPAGALAASMADSVTTAATVSDSSLVGVGDLLTIGSERLIVTDKTLAATTATVTGSVAASAGATTIPVSDGTLLHAGELILIGAERIFIEQIAGNNLIVRRAMNGSVLGTHASLDVVYAPRVCTVARGQTGTTAASHSSSDAISANDPPSLAVEASLAAALVYLEQSKVAWARVAGSGDNQREANGRALKQILDDLFLAHGRVRSGATR